MHRDSIHFQRDEDLHGQVESADYLFSTRLRIETGDMVGYDG